MKYRTSQPLSLIFLWVLGVDKLSFLCRFADNRNFSGLHYDDQGVIYRYNYAIRESVLNVERRRLEIWTGEHKVRLLLNTNP